MENINLVIVEGKFIHFTSKRGVYPLSFLIENQQHQHFRITVNEKEFADALLPHLRERGILHIVGKLVNERHTYAVVANHISGTNEQKWEIGTRAQQQGY